MSEEPISMTRLLKVYIAMRDELARMTKEFEEKKDKLSKEMQVISRAVLEHCGEHDIDSVKTEYGTGRRSIKTTYWTNDWESFHRFTIENKATMLYEKRIHQGNMKQFLEDNPDLLPPGLNIERQYMLTVTRPRRSVK